MKILIVDGDPQLLETMNEICELEGFQTVTHLNCDQALNEMKAGLLPVMIFCDIFPPKNGGKSFLKEMKTRKEWSSIPFILMNSFERKKSGDVTQLMKPFSIDEFNSHLDLIRPF